MPLPAPLTILPKPLLFGLYGGLGGLLGALLFGELVWFLLQPPPPEPPPPPPPPPPQVAVSASPGVQVYTGGTNTFAVSVARASFDGPVTVRLEDAPADVTMEPFTIPAGQTAATATVRAGPGAPPGVRKVKLLATAATAGGQPLVADTGVNVQVDPAPRVQADIVFVLDVTSSMGFAINGVQRGISRFVEDIGRSQLDIRVGLIAFGDRFEGEEPITLTFGGAPFTTDAGRFAEAVGRLRAVGGGDAPESSLDGLTDAARFPFRQGASKVLLLITDAAPLVPDRRTKSLQEAAGVLRAEGVKQLHVVASQRDLTDFYDPLRRMADASGRFFDLRTVARSADGSEFAAILPDLGRDIAARTIEASPARRPEVSATAPPAEVGGPVVRGVQSSQGFAAGSGGQLVFAVAAWTGAIAGLVCLALAAGQFHYLRSALPPPGLALAGLAGGLAAGLVGGAAGQGLYLAAPDSPVLEKLFRVLGWTALGGLAGTGLSFFIPNLKPWQGLVGGAAGGAAGAVGFLVVAALGSDLVGRLVGGLALGFFIGLMVAVVEAAFRSAWLEVWHGPREMITVNLGAEPVRVGGDARQCTVWARGAAPVAARCWVREGAVVWSEGGRESAVGAGFEKTLGSVRVVVRTGAGGGVAPSAPRPTALAAPPRPAPKPMELDDLDDLPMPVAAPRPTSPPPPAPKPVAAAPPKPAAPAPPRPAPPAPPKPVAAAPPKPAPPAPPKPAASTTDAAPDACPYCKGKHPGRPGARYCVIHDQSY